MLGVPGPNSQIHMDPLVFSAAAQAKFPNTSGPACIFSRVFSSFCPHVHGQLAQPMHSGLPLIFSKCPHVFSSDCPEQSSTEVLKHNCFQVICPRLYYQLWPWAKLHRASGEAKAEKTSLGRCPKNKSGRQAENTIATEGYITGVRSNIPGKYNLILYIYIYIYIYIYVSLSLSLYIYIYVHICGPCLAPRWA